jgi:hypothetical protein
LFNTKIAEERAASIVDHLGEGCGVRDVSTLFRTKNLMGF